MNIAVLIPCYNEELTIGNVINDFKRFLPEATIYVFDNNSTDRTSKIAKQEGAIVAREKRQGKGYVIQAMFQKIVADYYIIVDGDDTYPAEKIVTLLKVLMEDRADMVVGSRLQAYEKSSVRPFHLFGNKIVGFLVNKLFQSKLKDIMSGFRVLSKDLVQSITIQAKGFEVETEMTLQCLNKGFIIKEIEIPYKDRPKGSFSKLNTFLDGYRVIKEIFIIFRDYKPLLFFGSIGLFAFIYGLITGGIVVQEFIKTRYIARVPLALFAVGSVLFGILMCGIGLILEVIHARFNEIYYYITKIIKIGRIGKKIG